MATDQNLTSEIITASHLPVASLYWQLSKAKRNAVLQKVREMLPMIPSDLSQKTVWSVALSLLDEKQTAL